MIYFDGIVNGERKQFSLQRNFNENKLVLELFETQENKSIFLGEISIENLLSIVNREKLACKYGHQLSIQKRKREKK